MLEAVPSNIKNGLRRRRQMSRSVNFVLLLLIFYGATCGIVHSHNGYAQPLTNLGTSFNDARHSEPTAKLLSSGNACLLCQFHQQLAFGLVQATPHAQQPTATIARSVVLTFNDYSAPHDSSRGRAPPLASLL
jgi:hypothetical protein